MTKYRHNSGVRRLTKLLCMPSHCKLTDPDERWLEEQARGIRKLDKSLRRSTNLLQRISSRLDQFRDRPKAAQLCKAHYGLNPKLIRHHTHHLIAECTKRTVRLRVWQPDVTLPPSVRVWLQRIDALTALWMGAKSFSAVFGYDRGASSPCSVKDGCEACIMSAIGSQAQALIDLRASILSRLPSRSRRLREEPRLLRLLESWIDHFGRYRAAAIRNTSDMLCDQIQDVRQEIDRREEEEEAAYEEAVDTVSQFSQRRSIRRASSTRAESVERQVERRSIAEHQLHRQGLPGWNTNAYGRADYAYSRHSRERGAVLDESDDERTGPGSVNGSPSNRGGQDIPDGLEGYAASDWVAARMERQGLAPDERRQLLEEDTHPALSDYHPTNAVPSSSRTGQRAMSMTSGSDIRRQPQPALSRPASAARAMSTTGDESIWEPVSVVSFSAYGSRVPSREGSVVSGLSAISSVASSADLDDPRATGRAPSLMTLPPDDQPYLEFCENMGFRPNPAYDHQQRSSAPSHLASRSSDGGRGGRSIAPSSIYSQ